MEGRHQWLDGSSDQRCSKICGRQGQLEKGHTCRQPFNWRTAINDDDDCRRYVERDKTGHLHVRRFRNTRRWIHHSSSTHSASTIPAAKHTDRLHCTSFTYDCVRHRANLAISRMELNSLNSELIKLCPRGAKFCAQPSLCLKDMDSLWKRFRESTKLH